MHQFQLKLSHWLLCSKQNQHQRQITPLSLWCGNRQLATTIGTSYQIVSAKTRLCFMRSRWLRQHSHRVSSRTSLHQPSNTLCSTFAHANPATHHSLCASQRPVAPQPSNVLIPYQLRQQTSRWTSCSR
jgi:hypothetical protein